MDTSGQAAEQMVRYSIEGIEYALKFTGKGAERLAAILMSIARDQQKTRGRTSLTALLKSEKELTVFTIPENRLKDFALEAKRYGVLYCVLKEKRPTEHSLTDILVRAEDAAKINRIVERLGLGQVEITAEGAPEQVRHTAEELAEQAAEDLLEQILKQPEQAKENPTSARTEPSSLSGRGSTPSAADIDPFTPEHRPSVRAALAQIKQEQTMTHGLEQTEVAVEQQLLEIIGEER